LRFREIIDNFEQSATERLVVRLPISERKEVWGTPDKSDEGYWRDEEYISAKFEKHVPENSEAQIKAEIFNSTNTPVGVFCPVGRHFSVSRKFD